ncbi:DUF4848 domain-containing protein [uncultured Bacteroides sp.]|uniref:DUF4848 domain-containing protein n=1 Tax=uncultured Bacteroides sp. TaxID=162156 RepID=UPI002AAAB5A8|nr:DUF4848 domain-containing protein [uncultured Bacteroides sp.]
MKKRILKNAFFLFGTFFFLFSCSDEDNVTNETSAMKENAVQVVQLLGNGNVKPLTRSDNVPTENLALKFSSEQTYEATLEKLEGMTKEERMEWERQFPSFLSLEAVYNEAMEYAADSLEDSELSYRKFKAKYSNFLYFPEYKEDLGAYLPVLSDDLRSSLDVLSTVVNSNGLVVVGNEVKNMKLDSSYSELQNSGRAYYSNTEKSEVYLLSPMTRSSAIDWNTISYVDANDYKSYMLLHKNKQYIGAQYESGWRKRGKGKKLNFKFGRRFKDNRIVWHSEVSFRKHVWLGWVNYSSKTSLNGTIFYYDNNHLIGQQTIEHSANGSSSHDGYGALQFVIYKGHFDVPELLTIPVYAYYFPEIRGTASIDFRGFPSTEYYTWKMTYKNAGKTSPL